MILSLNTVKPNSEHVKLEVSATDFMDQEIVTVSVNNIDNFHSSIFWLLTYEQAQDLMKKLEDVCSQR